jgi:hypothetical protein
MRIDPMLNIGQSVTIVTGLNKHKVYSGTVKRMSPTGKRVVVSRIESGTEYEAVFYRQGVETIGQMTYVETPGTGKFGSMMNNQFTA